VRDDVECVNLDQDRDQLGGEIGGEGTYEHGNEPSGSVKGQFLD
jgi:hypothetical protein